MKSVRQATTTRVRAPRTVPGWAVGRKSKYKSTWTYYDGKTLHSTERDCRDALLRPCTPGQCSICSKRTAANSSQWYRSRAEAQCAQRLDLEVRIGKIRGWARSKSVLLVDAPKASDRIRYIPDFDVWITSAPEKETCDERIEVKGGRLGIAYSGKLKIRLYREAARRGEQPRLRVIDAKGRELNV